MRNPPCPVPLHLRLRIASKAMCTERSVLNVLDGKAMMNTYLRVLYAARSLRIPLGELPKPPDYVEAPSAKRSQQRKVA